jgi:hypothetical protein
MTLDRSRKKIDDHATFGILMRANVRVTIDESMAICKRLNKSKEKFTPVVAHKSKRASK